MAFEGLQAEAILYGAIQCKKSDILIFHSIFSAILLELGRIQVKLDILIFHNIFSAILLELGRIHVK